MKFSSIEISSAKIRPAPLSHGETYRLAGVERGLSAVHSVSGPGTFTAASDEVQPNSA
jgi:hypothetical protein